MLLLLWQRSHNIGSVRKANSTVRILKKKKIFFFFKKREIEKEQRVERNFLFAEEKNI